MVWGRSRDRVQAFRDAATAAGFAVEPAASVDALCAACDLVVTATPATEPLVRGAALRSGTHVTAVGADTPAKRELDAETFRRADRVVVDSLEQCPIRGEAHHALAEGAVRRDRLVELGDVIGGRAAGRTGDAEITVADLTGVAVQDVAIAAAVLEAAERSGDL
jgi:ornithine cyclodeaminase